MKRYEHYSIVSNLLTKEIPSHWEMKRNRAFLRPKFVSVGQDARNYSLLSLTTNGIILRDVESGKGKFPKDFDTYQVIDPNDIVFCLFDVDETPRTVGLSSLNGMLTGAYDAFSIADTVNPRFINYYYTAVDNIKALRPYYTGLRKVVKKDKFMAISIPIPPIEEQERIVAYLNKKITLIESCKCQRERELQALNELKQAEIASVVTRGLNPNVPMKDSGIPWIGQIPAHWETKRIASHFHNRIESNGDFEFKRAFKFNYGTIVPKEETGNPEEYHDVYVKYSKVKKNDIMINGLNLNYDFVSQRVAIVPEDGIITSAYVVLRPFETTFAPYYCYLFKAMDSMKLFHAMGTGIRLTLSFDELKKQIIPIPPVEEQKAIVNHIENRCTRIDNLIDNLKKEIENLQEYKLRLISDVVTGQIDVRSEEIA